jgi:hypothetical protein
MFVAFCKNLHDVDLDLYDVDLNSHEDMVNQITDARDIHNWAWVRLTAFAKMLGPAYVKEVELYFQADEGAVKSVEETLKYAAGDEDLDLGDHKLN